MLHSPSQLPGAPASFYTSQRTVHIPSPPAGVLRDSHEACAHGVGDLCYLGPSQVQTLMGSVCLGPGHNTGTSTGLCWVGLSQGLGAPVSL